MQQHSPRESKISYSLFQCTLITTRIIQEQYMLFFSRNSGINNAGIIGIYVYTYNRQCICKTANNCYVQQMLTPDNRTNIHCLLCLHQTTERAYTVYYVYTRQPNEHTLFTMFTPDNRTNIHCLLCKHQTTERTYTVYYVYTRQPNEHTLFTMFTHSTLTQLDVSRMDTNVIL